MSSKIFINAALKFIPQMDMTITYTENGGIEGTQTFLARKGDIGSGSNLNGFRRGTTWETLYPEIPSLYRFLTIKTFDPQDHQPGIVAIRATFTGTQFTGNGSSGEEDSVPTTSLRPNEEQKSITHHKKWTALTDASKKRLSLIMSGKSSAFFNVSEGNYGYMDDTNEVYTELTGAFWAVPTGDELEFATMIAEGETTYKAPSWSYVYRTEGKTGFTSAQLNEAFKIVGSPPGSPVKPGTGWTWMLVSPEQTQSGPDRFAKELTFQLIEDNDRNQFLYGS